MVETAILFQYLYYIQDRDLKKKRGTLEAMSYSNFIYIQITSSPTSIY